MTLPLPNDPDNDNSEQTNDRLLSEEKRLVVLNWLQTYERLKSLLELTHNPDQKTYVTYWLGEYEAGINRVLNELVVLDAKNYT